MARREINYEVHVLQSGRWEIQARYPEKKEKAAVEDAVVMGRTPGISGVRVIKEAYDPEEGVSKETVIYQHPRKKPDQGGSEKKHPGSPSESSSSYWDSSSPEGQQRKKSTRTEFWDEDDDDDDDDDYDYDDRKYRKKAKAASKKKKTTGKKSSLTSIIVKFLLIILFSVIVGAVCAALVSMMIRDTSMSTNAQTNIMFITFVVVFLSSAGYMGYSVLSKTTIKTASRRRTVAVASAPASAPTSTATRETVDKEKKNKKVNRDTYSEDEAFDSFLPTPDLEKVADSEDEDDDAEAEAEAAEEEKEVEKEEKAESLSKEAENQKMVMMKFLSDGLAKVQSGQNKLDSFNKFGINLFMAGGCEVLGKDHNLSPKSVETILSDGVQVMGFKKEDAASFAGKYEDYLLADSRYMQMFQAGRNAMNTYMNDPSTSAENMEKALSEWNKPKDREEKTGPVTVMFTDMVGSTALTQSKGDAAAQKVVHAHNRIVRDALNRYSGKEIKHTGDGIMASFSTTSNGVEAAIAIQNDVDARNRKKPDLPLHLKIGINAGEPISENDDLFGTTVQLSARIVDKAQSEQIFVSEIVRGICAGKDIGFINRGPYEMKGFAEPVTLYEVIWKDENSDS